MLDRNTQGLEQAVILENGTRDIGTAMAIGGGVSAVFLIAAIIAWILGVILFFKIWAMTNNVRKIKDTLEEWLDVEHPVISEKDNTDGTGEAKPQ